MRRRSRPAVQLEVLEVRSLLSASTSDDAVIATAAANSGASGQILVRFRDAPFNALKGTSLGESLPLVSGLYEVNLDPDTSVAQALAAYSSDARVLYAQEDFQLSVTRTPNDPGYSQTWGLNNVGQSGGLTDADIDAAEAWDRTTGSSSIIVGVIDTGVDYNHPDLAANIWTNSREIAGNGIDDDQDGYIDDVRGWDFVSNDNNPFDDNGHGTHVSGTIGAVGNNGIGVAGVAWNVRIMPLKFLGANGSGSTADAIRAIDYARINGAKILNNSWGGGGASQALSDAIERARQAGIIFVAAAGNSASNNDLVGAFPANYPQNNVVSVAATDRNDALASYSNFGVVQVDIGAPGSSIYSTLPNNSYGTYSGTSMATPHVAGALALVWSYFPQFTYRQVIDQVLNNVDRLPALATKVASGGRLNVFKAINAGSVDVSGAKIVSAEWSGSNSATLDRIRVTFSEAINSGTFGTGDVVLKGPNGATIPVTNVNVVANTGNTQFDILFAAKTLLGNYNVTVGPLVNDLSGNAMNQDGDALSGESTQDQFTGQLVLTPVKTLTWSGSTAIRDVATTTISLVVTEAALIDDLNVKINLSHTYDGDLLLTLIDPGGTRYRLFNRRGGSGDNILATFDDEAATLISAGTAPFNGSFRPEQNLSAVDGKQIWGTWKLEIQDLAAADVGTITSFSMIVAPRTTVASRGLFQTAEAVPQTTVKASPAFNLSTTTLNLEGPRQVSSTINGIYAATLPTVSHLVVRTFSTVSDVRSIRPRASEPIPSQMLDRLLTDVDALLSEPM